MGLCTTPSLLWKSAQKCTEVLPLQTILGTIVKQKKKAAGRIRDSSSLDIY
jgi:hypothetical protein